MKKFAICLAALFALASSAAAATTTVEDFRGTVQTVTSTGGLTLSLGSTTTIVRINASSEVNFYGMTGGADGRMVIFMNVGSAHAYFEEQHASATSSDRFRMDANTGHRALYAGGQGFGIAVYDGTSSRWQFVAWDGFNTAGPMTIIGQSVMYGALTQVSGNFTGENITLADAASNTRLTLKSTTSNDNASTVRWKNNSNTTLFSLGPDYWDDGGQNFWLYDNTNSLTPLYLDQSSSGVSWLSMGTSSGGMEWNENDWPVGVGTVDGLLRFFANGLYRMTISDYFVAFNSQPYYQRIGASLPTLESNCNGSGSASFARDDSSDARGAITLGTGATACTMNFAAPWDLIGGTEIEDREGFPICVANTSTAGRSVSITNITDHLVTFTPSASGATTIYYHCDGVLQNDVFD